MNCPLTVASAELGTSPYMTVANTIRYGGRYRSSMYTSNKYSTQRPSDWRIDLYSDHLAMIKVKG